MIKYLQKQEYAALTKVFVKEKVEHVTFNFTLENQVHRQGEYFNDKWVHTLVHLYTLPVCGEKKKSYLIIID